MRDDGSWSKVLQWKWTLESQNYLMFPNWVPELELGPCHSLQQGAPEEV